MEPLAKAVNACKQGKVSSATSVLIIGAGPLGLLCLAAAQQFGVTDITTSGTDRSYLTIAQQMGARAVMCGQEDGQVKEEAI